MIKLIEPLGKHDRAAFSCGVAALDDWFRFRAGQHEKRNLARVFVAIDDQLGVVGFHAAPLAPSWPEGPQAIARWSDGEAMGAIVVPQATGHRR
jgi:hypothetical protein